MSRPDVNVQSWPGFNCSLLPNALGITTWNLGGHFDGFHEFVLRLAYRYKNSMSSSNRFNVLFRLCIDEGEYVESMDRSR